jgi:hypothetical protein
VSVQGYNTQEDVDALIWALRVLLPQGSDWPRNGSLVDFFVRANGLQQNGLLAFQLDKGENAVLDHV